MGHWHHFNNFQAILSCMTLIMDYLREQKKKRKLLVCFETYFEEIKITIFVVNLFYRNITRTIINLSNMIYHILHFQKLELGIFFGSLVEYELMKLKQNIIQFCYTISLPIMNRKIKSDVSERIYYHLNKVVYSHVYSFNFIFGLILLE